jgi:hypothetical protein
MLELGLVVYAVGLFIVIAVELGERRGLPQFVEGSTREFHRRRTAWLASGIGAILALVGVAIIIASAIV